MIAVLVCALAMLVLQVLTPFWWWVMIVPFAHGVAVARSGWRALRTGFVSAGLLWLGAGAYLFLTGSRTISERVAKMFGLGRSWPLVLITGLVAAIAAAASGYAGFAVRALFRPKPPEPGGPRDKP